MAPNTVVMLNGIWAECSTQTLLQNVILVNGIVLGVVEPLE